MVFVCSCLQKNLQLDFCSCLSLFINREEGKKEGQLIIFFDFQRGKKLLQKLSSSFLFLLLLEKDDQNCGCLVAVSLWLQVGKKGFCLLTEGIIITATMWETMLGKGFKVSKW